MSRKGKARQQKRVRERDGHDASCTCGRIFYLSETAALGAAIQDIPATCSLACYEREIAAQRTRQEELRRDGLIEVDDQ